MHSIIQVAYSHNKIYNQTMNKLPANWKKLKIEDCADIIGGGTPSTKKKEYWDGNISWITPKDLSNYNSRYISRGSRNISEKGLKYSSARLLPKNSVLLTTRAPIGYLAISKKELATNQGFKSLIMKNGNVPEFFYYLLKNNIAKLLQYASGTTFMELNATNLKSIEFYIPEVAEQKRIASILSSFDDKIELNNKTNKILEEMAQTIFEEWFINFNFPNANGKPYKKSGGEMINSELGGIPKGWKVGILDDIINIESGKRPNVSSKNMTTEYNIPIYGASSQIGYTNSVLFNEKILITGRVGTHGIVQRINFPCWASDNTFVIRSKFHEYTYQNLKRIDYINLNRGTTQPLIVQSDIKKVKILLNDKIINQYENLTSSLWELWHKNIFENEKLSGIRDSLLPKLMAGEIRAKK